MAGRWLEPLAESLMVVGLLVDGANHGVTGQLLEYVGQCLHDVWTVW